MWINTIAKCRDKLIRINLEREKFVDFDDVRSVPPGCLGIIIGENKVALYPQKAIYQISVDGDQRQYGEIMACIIYNNKQLDLLKIHNMTNTIWRGWSPKTRQLTDIHGGKEYYVSPGVMIVFKKENPRIVGVIFDARIRNED